MSLVETIAIGASEGIEDIRRAVEDRLRADLGPLADAVEFTEVARGSWRFLGVRLPFSGPGAEGRSEAARAARRSLADAVGDVIFRRWEPRLLRRMLRLYERDLTPAERLRAYRRARGRLSQRDAARGSAISRAAGVKARLEEYLAGSNHLIVDGFLTFRLKDYLAELEEVVDLAVDDLLLDREYEEFVEVLRHFVETRPPKVEAAEVTRLPDGRFRLLDERQRPLPPGFLVGLEGARGSDVTGEDVLVSALVILAPRSVRLHRLAEVRELKDALDAIRRVFGARVRECAGCAICAETGTDAPDVPPLGPRR